MATTTEPPNYTLFDALTDWGNANTDQIREAHLSKGGWEGWAQEEMRMLFNAGREDNCYLNNARQAADIVLTPGTSGGDVFAQPYVDEECVVIELKCESFWNALKFGSEVKKDLRKVNSGVFSRSLLRRGCNVYCIALAMSNEGACKMEKLGLELFEGGTLEAPFQLWWFMRRFEAENWSDDSDDDGDEQDEEDDEDEDEDEEDDSDEVDFDSSEVESDEDEDGYDDGYDNEYQNGYGSGYGNEYHSGQGGWDYNYS
ncbi:hypothetical protein RU639_002125 [Aspergillus parasiticus]